MSAYSSQLAHQLTDVSRIESYLSPLLDDARPVAFTGQADDLKAVNAKIGDHFL